MKKEILPLTGMRFIAALYVFIIHIHIRWPLTDSEYVGTIWGQGAIGMSLFFILSGFILTNQYADGEINLKKYFVNRFARIYPIYAIAAIITLPWIGVDGFSQLIILIFADIFLIQAWFPQFFRLWNNGASWSLSVEAFCYFLLPFLIPKFIKFNNKQIYLLILISYFLTSLPGIVCKFFTNEINYIFYSIPIFRLPEFLVGVGVALLVKTGFKYNQYLSFIQVVFILCFVGYIAFFGRLMPLYIGHNWIVVPFVAFMIYSLYINNNGFLGKCLSNKFFVWLGKVSYCFYLFQTIFIFLMMDYHDKLVNRFPAFMGNNLIIFLVMLIGLTLFSAFFYHFFEEPLRAKIKKKYQ